MFALRINSSVIIILSIAILLIAIQTPIKSYASETPSWINHLKNWYNEGLISRDDLVNALQFLSYTHVISKDMIGVILSGGSVQEGNDENYTISITNGIKHIVPLDKIVSGGPPKDGIPSIDYPQFENVSDVTFLNDNDLVIGVVLNGEVKAYPLPILVWHEIVNDMIGNTPIAITYCPLCFTTQVFDRTINGTEVEFGTSGKLYNSNLVMYDRSTDSLWSEALGLAIKGDLTGYNLKTYPSDIVRWGDWKLLYPDSQVLTEKTGFIRPYGTDPYGDYYSQPTIYFPVDHQDDRLPPKKIICGYHHGSNYKAYKLDDIESSKIINDDVGGKKILIASLYPDMVRAFDRNVDGKILGFDYSNGEIIDKETNSKWNIEGLAISGPLKGAHLERLTLHSGFWFAWAAFHSGTAIYNP